MVASNKFPVVALGASAGGIPAMEGFFKDLPLDCGMAFVIVTHLSPERDSLLHEVLSHYTKMPVQIAEQDTAVEAGVVYVMPENVVMTIADGKLQLKPLLHGLRERKPIDIFFAALATDQGENAVGVVLSGGDGDGTLGARAIKEQGGLTVAQDIDSYGPRNPDMPEHAIASGVIDLQTPADGMGLRIRAYLDGIGALPGTEDTLDEATLNRHRNAICALLRDHSGHDFSGYKSKTFLRRVRRRMQLSQVQTMEGYVALLRRDADEVMTLFRDLLINVTSFFRDVEAFAELEAVVIPKLFEGKTAADTVRIWIPGCATGEEVYSIAILVREYMDGLSAVPRVQIFATDIDEAALAVARMARYPEPLLDGLSEARRQRFFISDSASFAVRSEVRELCVFSPHSVFRDPPFSRMDLVSCRNLLIYLGPEIQNRIIPTFHYALNPGGYLFLGSSEGISQHADLFATVDKKHRIFQARETGSSLPLLSTLVGEGRVPAFSSDRRERGAGNVASPLRQAVEAQVLERFSPAHVVVNGDGDVVYYSQKTGRFLEAAQGTPSRQLLSLARRGLRLELRAALREAMATRRPVNSENIPLLEDDGREQLVNLTIEPVADRDHAEPLFLVLFHAIGTPQQRAPHSDAGGRAVEHAADLERELRDTKERLQSTIEEYETAVEELKSSNEELVSVNEEAQSTNEELEASKEEMQSLNEELNTINAELSGKLEELDRANSDLVNLFESAQIATVFLDRNLVIRNFTPAASAYFNLRSSDTGRPLTDLTTRLDYPGLQDDIRSVFETGSPHDQQLARDNQGRFHLVRLMPYRDDGKETQGVVVTLVDVTLLAEAEEHQQVLIAELNHRVKNMLSVVISIANQTLDRSKPADTHAALIGRLRAMAGAYGVLSRVNWTKVRLSDLIDQELAPFDAARLTISGPDVQLEPQPGLSMGIVVHELATNAAKYGALSNAEGHLDVTWLVADGMLEFNWTERGGPRVAEPEIQGFGLNLLQGEIGYRLGGTVSIDFAPGGLIVDIAIAHQA